MDKIWITWQLSQRSIGLSQALELPLIKYTQDGTPIKRHILSSVWTIYSLIRYRPEVICLQYSFMLLLIISLYKKLFIKQSYIICDCHTKALRRSVSGSLGRLFWFLKRKSFSNVDLSIISNSGLTEDIVRLTDSYMILPDKIPVLSSDESYDNHTGYCVFVCSYAVDEPLNEMVEAGVLLSGVMPVFITGKIPHHMNNLKDQPYDNITFTDFVSAEAYNKLLGDASVIVALTTEEDCLQCAGYEALALNRPLVVSNTQVLREYFNDSAVYTANNSKSIYKAVVEAQNNNARLRKNEQMIKQIREKEFAMELGKLKSIIYQE